MRSTVPCYLAVALFLMSMDALAAPLCVNSSHPAIPPAYRCGADAGAARERTPTLRAADRARLEAGARQFAQSLREHSDRARSGSRWSEARDRARAQRQAAARQKAAEEKAAQGQQELADGGTTPVPAPVIGAVRLSWVIPTSRENGKPLQMSDLAGYELYYVSEDEQTSGVVEISRPDQAEYVLANLIPGAYYFAISAIDSNGLKSRLSPMVETSVGS